MFKVFITLICLSLFHQIQGQSVDLYDSSVNWFIFQDSDNFTWISSPQGWNRYDGKESVYYSCNDDKHGIKGNWIQSNMYESADDNLYFTTYTFLNAYSSKTNTFEGWKVVFKGDTLREDYHVFKIDTFDHNLYMKADSFLFKYNYKTKKVEEFIGITKGKRFTYDPSKKLLVSSLWGNGNGIEIFKNSNGIWTKNLIANQLKAKGLDPNISQSIIYGEDIWLCSDIGIHKVNYRKEKVNHFRLNGSNIHVNSFLLVGDQLVMATKSLGLQIFDLKIEEFVPNNQVVDFNKLLLTQSPVEMYYDLNKRLWISHDKVGVQLIHFDLRESLIKGVDTQLISPFPITGIDRELYISLIASQFALPEYFCSAVLP